MARISHWCRVVVWGAIALCMAPLCRAEFRVEASVDYSTIGVEDVVQLTVTARDKSTPNIGTPILQELEGFVPLGSPASGRHFEFVNGRTSSSRHFTWTLKPPREGEFVIGPAKVVFRGEEYETNRVRIKVVAGSVLSARDAYNPWGNPMGRSGRRQSHPAPRVLTDLSKSEVYVGEPVVLVYRLRSTLSLLEGQMAEAPEFPGFLVHDGDVEQRRRRVGEEDGLPVYEHVLGRFVLIPLEAGSLGIAASSFQLTFRVPDDSFGLGFFSRKQKITKTAEAKVLKVSPLPLGDAPFTYEGAVGRFGIEGSLSGNQGQVGEALTLRLSLSGTGNFPQLGPPDLSELDGFKVYEPQVSGTVLPTPNGLNGSRTWEYVLIPNKAGTLKIPSIPFSYFDPSVEQFRTDRTRPLEIRVAGSPSGDPLIPAAAGDGAGGPVTGTSAAAMGVLLPKPLEPAEFETRRQPLQTMWFWGLAMTPLLMTIGAVALRASALGKHDREDRRRVRAAKHSAQVGLRKAKAKIKQDAPFFGGVQSALEGYVRDKTGRTAVSLGSREVQSILEGIGLEGTVGSALVRLIEDCENGRFRPTPAGMEEKKRLLSRASDLLSTLEKTRPGKWMTILLLGVCSVLLAANGVGAESTLLTGVEGRVANAFTHWSRAEYGEAIEIYEGLLESSPASSALRYNLGISLYRDGQLGRAVAELERARRLAPGDRQVRQTIRWIREEHKLPTRSDAEFRELLETLFGSIPPSLLAWFGLVLWLSFGAAVTWRLLKGVGTGSLVVRWSTGILLGAVLVSGGLCWYVRGGGATEAVVLAKTAARSGPSPEYPSLRTVQPGEKGKLIRERDGWAQLQLVGGLTAWIAAQDTERI